MRRGEKKTFNVEMKRTRRAYMPPPATATPEEMRRAADELFNLPSKPRAKVAPQPAPKPETSARTSALSRTPETRHILPTLTKQKEPEPEYIVMRGQPIAPIMPKKRGPKKGSKRTSYNLRPKPELDEFAGQVTIGGAARQDVIDPALPRRRGRPRKIQPPQPFPILPQAPLPKRAVTPPPLDENGMPIKRPRGRPRKVPLSEPALIAQAPVALEKKKRAAPATHLVFGTHKAAKRQVIESDTRRDREYRPGEKWKRRLPIYAR